jgi:mono/diheme cytochrome c family protein
MDATDSKSIAAGAVKVREAENRTLFRALSCFQLVLLLGLAVAVAPSAFCRDERSVLFAKACASCHGKDGKAQTPAAKKLGVKDLSESKLTDEQIVEQILEGKLDQKKESKMPSFKEKLTKAELDSLIPVVKAFRK